MVPLPASHVSLIPTRVEYPCWIFSIYISTPSPFHAAALSRSSWTWKFSKCHPSAHTRRTYACPHLHTPWIFLFNEGIHCINLASFSLFYMQEHKHIKIKTLFSKSHSHKSGWNTDPIIKSIFSDLSCASVTWNHYGLRMVFLWELNENWKYWAELFLVGFKNICLFLAILTKLKRVHEKQLVSSIFGWD